MDVDSSSSVPIPNKANPWPVEPQNSRLWRQDSSQLGAHVLGEHVIAFEAVGNLSDDAMPFVQEQLGAFLDRSGAAHMFWHAWKLERFGSRFRDGLVKMLVDRRSQWKSCHVLVQSVLVSMTVSTLGLSLFGRLKSYREPKEFFAAVERALGSG